jgi:hypothetical protein
VPPTFVDHYRCPHELGEPNVTGALKSDPGYFTFHNTICYGRSAVGPTRGDLAGPLPDLTDAVDTTSGEVRLPFDLSDVVTNLQRERYRAKSGESEGFTSSGMSKALYYTVRPLLPVTVRKHLQRVRLNGWEAIKFPHWPVDCTVQTLMEETMALVLKTTGREKIPFVWFWPDGAPSCSIMTHDVEQRAGRDFCDRLMDVNETYGIKASFQLVPEVRYDNPPVLLDRMRRRGFEVNVHDLNHDGLLYQSRERFLSRVGKINEYGRAFGSRGFRAGAMYREPDWFDALEFSYDMSVPSVAHLEPQRGGCCSVMPYFVGNLVELPLTTIQDYSLFHIIGDYSIDLWKHQIDLIRAKHGLISFIAHPDYLMDSRAMAVYEQLLAHLRDLSSDGKVWFALPREVDTWWRRRHCMDLVADGTGWRIDGPDSERARVAYARLDNGRVVYEIAPAS